MMYCDAIAKGKEPMFLQKCCKSGIHRVLGKGALAVCCPTNKAVVTESNSQK